MSGEIFRRGGVLCAAPFRYEGPVRERLIQMKSVEHKRLAAAFAPAVAQAVRRGFSGERFGFVCCVPAYEPGERAYNQARVLARAVAVELGAPLRDVLVQPVPKGAKQRMLDAAHRAENVRGAYTLRQDAGSLYGACALLVDDIITTGATLRSCAGVLEASGARVLCAVAARTEKEEKQNFVEQSGKK